ncbi:hypothetical protein QZH41_001263 [Actinostola sp. cb2023]|nr:hypothetical protein QZH41_001263 [Actinostola sp. cb2023]
MFSSWTGDVRWTKLRQFESSSDSSGQTKKVLQTASDDSDDEWLAQLEKDYASSARKRYRGKCTFIERCLITALAVTIIITVTLASLMIARNYGTSIRLVGRLKTLECESKGCISAAYSAINKIDEEVKPCDDFYRYACGKWLRNVFVPNGNAKYTSFHYVSERNEMKLKRIFDQKDLGLNESAKVTDKVQNFYRACMNKTNIDQSGNEPIVKLIQDVGSWALTGGNAWSAETWNFEQALSTMHKLQSRCNFFDMIGYPDWIENPIKLEKYYENLTVSPDNSFENLLNARRFYHQRSMDRRGKNVDRKEWHMTPTEVNAYYNAPNNYIAFPSGILQQPFFDPEFPKAVNYGGIGVVMGHELTHGFDNKGRKFDKNGNLESWWKNVSAVAFKERSSCMVDQYGNYTVAGQRVNGNQTLSENIADNGGLKLAYKGPGCRF